jgi:hypothetical protein
MDDAKSATDEVFYTDKQLCARWQCSHMKLWRLWQKGKLKPIKIDGIGTNLTPRQRSKRSRWPMRAPRLAMRQRRPLEKWPSKMLRSPPPRRR